MKLIEGWKIELQNKRFLWTLVVILSIFVVQMIFISFYQIYIEERSGVVFEDPLMKYFDAINLDLVIFFALYTAHFLAIFTAIKLPYNFLQLLCGYQLIYFFRIFSIYLMPLEAPLGTLPLYDPILIWFGNGNVITKDLFYSGHTASTFIAFLITKGKGVKLIIFIALIVVVVGILLQRVHYTIDVYVAFFTSFTSYILTCKIINWVKK